MVNSLSRNILQVNPYDPIFCRPTLISPEPNPNKANILATVYQKNVVLESTKTQIPPIRSELQDSVAE
jgi:hypothetical protein